MNWTIEIIGAVTTGLAVAGVLYNNRMNAVCFKYWLASNALSCGIHLAAGLWSLAVRDGIFLVLAIEGMLRWGKIETTDFTDDTDLKKTKRHEGRK